MQKLVLVLTNPCLKNISSLLSANIFIFSSAKPEKYLYKFSISKSPTFPHTATFRASFHGKSRNSLSHDPLPASRVKRVQLFHIPQGVLFRNVVDHDLEIRVHHACHENMLQAAVNRRDRMPQFL